MPFGFQLVGGEVVAAVDSIMSVGSTLLNLDASEFSNGDLVYVGNETHVGQGSIKAFVRVRRNASLTPLEGVVWDSAVTTGVQYERIFEASAFQLQQTAWWLTNDDGLGAGIVDNSGTSAFPISMRELNRRRSGDAYGISTTITVTVPTSGLHNAARPELETCKLSEWWTDNAAGKVLFIGTPTVLFAGASSGFSGWDPSGNTPSVLTSPGLGTAFNASGLLQAVLRVPLSEGVSRLCIVQAFIDADNVHVSDVRDAEAETFNVGVVSGIADSTAIQLLDVPEVDIWPFVPGRVPNTSSGFVAFNNFDANGNEMDLGNDNHLIIGCLTNCPIKGGGPSAGLSCVGLLGHTTFDSARVTLYSVAANRQSLETNGHITATNSFIKFDGEQDFTNAFISLDGCNVSPLVAGDLNTAWGFFSPPNDAVACFDLDNWTKLNCSGISVFGSNSDILIAQVPAGCMMRLSFSLVTIANSGPDFAVQDGTGGDYGFYDISQVSIPNPNGGGGVIDTAIPRLPFIATFEGSITTANGSASASFLANPGSTLSTANVAAAQQYPATRSLVRQLSVVKLADTAGVNVVVTLMNSGGTGATALTVTVLHADPVGTEYTSTAAPITIGGPQTMDIKLTAASDAAPGTVKVSATLRG